MSSTCPDFVDDDDELQHQWAEYCAQQESTRHHLWRCLNK